MSATFSAFSRRIGCRNRTKYIIEEVQHGFSTSTRGIKLQSRLRSARSSVPELDFYYNVSDAADRLLPGLCQTWWTINDSLAAIANFIRKESSKEVWQNQVWSDYFQNHSFEDPMFIDQKEVGKRAYDRMSIIVSDTAQTRVDDACIGNQSFASGVSQDALLLNFTSAAAAAGFPQEAVQAVNDSAWRLMAGEAMDVIKRSFESCYTTPPPLCVGVLENAVVYSGGTKEEAQAMIAEAAKKPKPDKCYKKHSSAIY